MSESLHNSSLFQKKIKFERSYSTNPKQSIHHQPKSLRKLKEIKKLPEVSYIASSLENIEKGCIDEKTGLLKIDGDYGDYRMKIFRKKDKLRHYNDPKSIFSDKDFIQNIFDSFHLPPNKVNNPEVAESVLGEEQIESKKTIRHERARLGLKRQNSLISPSLKEIEIEKELKKKDFGSDDENTELANKINSILAKPRELYLIKEVQINEDEERQKLKKGVEQELREKEGHLFYRSIPHYMAEKWFKTVDNSTPDGNKIIPYVEEPPIEPLPKKNHHKRTHIFRFLEQNCKFKNEKPYKSMIFH